MEEYKPIPKSEYLEYYDLPSIKQFEIDPDCKADFMTNEEFKQDFFYIEHGKLSLFKLNCRVPLQVAGFLVQLWEDVQGSLAEQDEKARGRACISEPAVDAVLELGDGQAIFKWVVREVAGLLRRADAAGVGYRGVVPGEVPAAVHLGAEEAALQPAGEDLWFPVLGPRDYPGNTEILRRTAALRSAEPAAGKTEGEHVAGAIQRVALLPVGERSDSGIVSVLYVFSVNSKKQQNAFYFSAFLRMQLN